MNLKDLLGESYHDDMTFDEISNVLSNMKLADLSSGLAKIKFFVPQ